MATWSSNISTNLKLYLEITQVSQDVVNNTSQVRIRGYVYGYGNGAWNQMTTYGNVKLNGVTYNFSVPSYDFSGDVSLVLKDVTATVAHNSDGTKTVSGSVYWDPDNPDWLDAKTVSGSLGLTTIPRATKFTASNVIAGAASIPISITLSEVATTHKVKVMYGSITIVADKDVGLNPTSISVTSSDWTTFYNASTTVEFASLTITLTTYNGTTALGTDVKTITATYASTDVPIFDSVTASDNNTAVSGVLGAGNYLQLLSQIKSTINGAAGVKSSTISEYSITIKQDTTVIQSYSVNDPVWTPNIYGTVTAVAKVKDSRGRWSAEQTLSITIQPYARPVISNVSVVRADVSGTPGLLGEYAKVQFDASVTSVQISAVEKNTLQYKIDDITGTLINKVALTTHTGLTATALAKTFGDYPIANTAILLVTVSDAFGQSAPAQLNLPLGETTMTWGKKGIAVGGVFVPSGAVLQTYGTSNFTDNATFEKEVSALSVKVNSIDLVYEIARGGTNETGYVKYSDGRMEQWKTISIPGMTFPTPLGTLYYAGNKSMGNFLLAFATYDSTCSLEMECSNPDVFCVHGGMSNSSSAGNIYPLSARNAPATVFKVRIRAWGTW